MALLESLRHTLATEGDTGFLIYADACEESENPDNRRFGELLRLYVEVQTFVRMSMPIPADKSARYAELNKSFQIPEVEYGDEGWYENQLGPYYMKYTGRMTNLANHLSNLEHQPIRQLVITEADTTPDLAMLFRNHRMDYMTHLTVRFRYNQRRQEAQVGRALTDLVARNLQELRIEGVTNRLNIIPAIFQGNRFVAKGCCLLMGQNRMGVKL